MQRTRLHKSLRGALTSPKGAQPSARYLSNVPELLGQYQSLRAGRTAQPHLALEEHFGPQPALETAQSPPEIRERYKNIKDEHQPK